MIPVNWFDTVIISFLNQVAGRSWSFDTAVQAVQNTHLPEEVLLMACWWTWFHYDGEAASQTRETMVVSVVAVFLAVGLSILLLPWFPSYGRPLQAGALARLPFGVSPDTRVHASFPSHHAMVASVLVVGLFLASRATGVAAALYSVAIIGVSPVYLGLHYPTDILGGALLGITIGGVLNVPAIRRVMAARRVVAFAARQPAIFYAVAFLVTLQVATLFDDAGPVGRWLIAVVRALRL